MRRRMMWQWSLLAALAGLGIMVAPAFAADEIVLDSAISQTGKYAREGKLYVDAYTRSWWTPSTRRAA